MNQVENIWFRYRGLENWIPNNTDLDLTKSLFIQALNDHYSDYDVKPILEDLDNYYFQLIPYISDKGEKIIYVNSFCEFYENWEERLNDVDDGGWCFWQVEINVEINDYFGFSINGM